MAAVCLLDPYHGGSHAAFAAGWAAHSRHVITVRGLPAHHWKWRMRRGAWDLATSRDLPLADAIVATDMLDLAAWRGLAPPHLARLPHAFYLHENQLLYPDERAGERDLHFAYTNLQSAAAAEAVWFNSDWHRRQLLAAAGVWFDALPGAPPAGMLARIARRSAVHSPGWQLRSHARQPADGPCHLLWAARWEADKQPELFAAALERAWARGADCRVSVIGGHTRREPPAFARLRQRHRDRIIAWGHLPQRDDYDALLHTADVFVSTAAHEFFGIAAVEAVAAGAHPLLPRALAYPEVFATFPAPGCDDGFHDGSVDGLARRICELSTRHARGTLWQGDPQRGRRAVAHHHWNVAAAGLDAAVDRLLRSGQTHAQPDR